MMQDDAMMGGWMRSGWYWLVMIGLIVVPAIAALINIS